MQFRSIVAIYICLITSWVPSCFAIDLSRFEKSPFLKKIRSYSGAVLLLQKDQILFKEVFGFRKNRNGKIQPQTLFPLASVSKTISAALVGSLVKQGKLSFEDPVSIALPKLNPQIKLKHLLSHSTGFSENIGNKAIEMGKKREELIHLFDGRSPEFTPGKNYFYSNVIYSYLEELVQEKTHQNFEKNMKYFLSSIGIEEGGLCQTIETQDVAFPHSINQKEKGQHLVALSLPKAYPTEVCSAGGLFLSIEQISQFLKLMLGQFPQVLDQPTISSLLQPQVEVTDIFRRWQIQWPYPLKELKSSYGLGWRILEHTGTGAASEIGSQRFYFHSGHLNGVSTFVGILPEKGLAIAVLSNQDAYFTEEVGFELWKL